MPSSEHSRMHIPGSCPILDGESHLDSESPCPPSVLTDSIPAVERTDEDHHHLTSQNLEDNNSTKNLEDEYYESVEFQVEGPVSQPADKYIRNRAAQRGREKELSDALSEQKRLYTKLVRENNDLKKQVEGFDKEILVARHNIDAATEVSMDRIIILEKRLIEDRSHRDVMIEKYKMISTENGFLKERLRKVKTQLEKKQEDDLAFQDKIVYLERRLQREKDYTARADSLVKIYKKHLNLLWEVNNGLKERIDDLHAQLLRKKHGRRHQKSGSKRKHG
ncbi:hypothetical protein BO78DRAFT_427203 [Aspergillus sclerotiicarbonarius CBS 121057]|uniref:Uncharacterized protein n=1 Tax=Aspergillus sclerotiicarbonarius (strain CBS 121057 / IBT 28362) TaxID=1448318 RepID=A0A319EHT5_ASPSB|nr:hypothetical protein BO78DRAFT_427203 [Aspergillus sclerotiicarbonarius CBS 121057]